MKMTKQTHDLSVPFFKDLGNIFFLIKIRRLQIILIVIFLRHFARIFKSLEILEDKKMHTIHLKIISYFMVLFLSLVS